MIDVIANIVWIVFMLAGAGLEAHRFLKGDKSYTTIETVDAAIRRHRIALVCFIVAAAGAFVGDNFIFGVNVVMWGVLLNDGFEGLGKQRKRILAAEEERQQEEDQRRAEAALSAPAAAAALGVSPAALDGVDPEILAEIQRTMSEPQKDKER